MTNIIKYDARDELIQKVVYEISNDLRSALDSNKYITFAVPGGTTPGPILEKLSDVYGQSFYLLDRDDFEDSFKGLISEFQFYYPKVEGNCILKEDQMRS